MSPKSRFASSEDVTVAAPKLSEIVEAKKEIKWGYDFERIDRPFGIDQHIFNILWLGPAHLVALFSFYLVFFTDQVPCYVLPFGKITQKSFLIVCFVQKFQIQYRSIVTFHRTRLWVHWRIGYHSRVSPVISSIDYQSIISRFFI